HDSPAVLRPVLQALLEAAARPARIVRAIARFGGFSDVMFERDAGCTAAQTPARVAGRRSFDDAESA
ncbi:MAG: hypothetical protein C4325_14075, partial [Blastocatellia bacterium]